MKDLERLGDVGSDEERRLVRAAQEVAVPAGVAEEVQRAVEARRQPRSQRWRWLLAGGLLVAGAAVAANWPHGLPAPETRPDSNRSPVRPLIVPLPRQAPAPAVAAPPPRRRPVGHVAQGPLLPGLDLSGYLRGAEVPAGAPPAPVNPIIVARSDRQAITLEATRRAVRGTVRGVTLELGLDSRDLTGHLGGDAVHIHIFAAREAHGTVGGREVDFTFSETDHGRIAEVSLPDVGGRVRLEPGLLSFRPGCDRDLPATRPGVYEGACADGTTVKITVPGDFLDPVSRLVVLGLLLPEPEAVLRGRLRGLFPPP